MKTVRVVFKNKPMADGTVETFAIDGCLVAETGSPTAKRPQIQIHLPKTNGREVDGAFVEYAGYDYHIVGVMVPRMNENTPTIWNRYAIAERIRVL